MIQYKQTINKGMNDEFSSVLKEAHDLFNQRHQVNIIGEGIKDVLTVKTNFASYVDALTEGLEATEEEQVRTLMENARFNILRESSTSGIAPVSSLTMPIIRKMWARVALKYAVPTEPVSLPSFSVAFSKPFIQDANGNKHYLPEALKSNSSLADKKRLSTEPVAVPADGVDLLALVGATKATGDSIDTKFSIVKAVVTALDANGENGEEVTANLNIKLDINRRLYGEVVGKHTDGTVTTDVLMGSVDLGAGKVTLMSLKGAVKSVEVLGWVSSEAHNTATNVSFEIERRDIEIGTGEHIEASLPLEFLQDVMALYTIDGANEAVEIMSSVTAQKVDQEIYTFLEKAYAGTGAKYRGVFDVHPATQFAGNPRDWLEELKRVIDFHATKMKSESLHYSGYFMIIGNPLDTMLIPNVTWTFNNVTDKQAGIEVEYSVGALSGSNRYTVVSSDLIPQGALTMFFCPSVDKFKTFTYYPYTYNVVHNYLNTQKQNVPSVMMTKRHTLEEFLPIIAQIEIRNNDGSIVKG